MTDMYTWSFTVGSNPTASTHLVYTTMKIRFTLKDTNLETSFRNDYAGQSRHALTMHDEDPDRELEDDEDMEIDDASNQDFDTMNDLFLEYGEYITVEYDTASETMTVVKKGD